MAKINVKNLPLYLRIIIITVPSLILVLLFIFLIYSPKNEEINALNVEIAEIDNEIASAEVKVRKLDELKAENALLRAKLAKLQEQLPEEKEVTVLLKEISDLGLKSGLEILLWKPGARREAPSGLYMEIPVKVEVITAYHDLGVFFSHISRLARIVNITDINLGLKGRSKKKAGYLITAKFTALTFAAITSALEAKVKEKQEKDKKGRKK